MAASVPQQMQAGPLQRNPELEHVDAFRRSAKFPNGIGLEIEAQLVRFIFRRRMLERLVQACGKSLQCLWRKPRGIEPLYHCKEERIERRIRSGGTPRLCTGYKRLQLQPRAKLMRLSIKRSEQI